jgi:hypothetical protein
MYTYENMNRIIAELAKEVNPELLEMTKSWPDEAKMYIYLHTIQLAKMNEFKKLLLELKNE